MSIMEMMSLTLLERGTSMRKEREENKKEKEYLQFMFRYRVSGAGIQVGIVDDGVQENHPDYTYNKSASYLFLVYSLA